MLPPVKLDLRHVWVDQIQILCVIFKGYRTTCCAVPLHVTSAAALGETEPVNIKVTDRKNKTFVSRALNNGRIKMLMHEVTSQYLVPLIHNTVRQHKLTSHT